MENYSLYGGKVTLGFDKFKHQYQATVQTKNGLEIFRPVGVTTATSVVDKSGPLVYWAVNKKTIPYLKEQIQPGRSYDEIQLNTIFKEASYQHKKGTDHAADVGTMGHDWIEQYIKFKLGKIPLAPEMPVAPTLQNLVKAFLEWESGHKVAYHESEKKVYSVKHNYAGTLDIEATVDDELAVCDIKTSNGIHEEHRFQVSAYMGARMEEMKKKYKAYWIIRLGKETKNDKVDFEAVRFDAKKEWKHDFGAFLACLALRKRLFELKPYNRYEN